MSLRKDLIFLILQFCNEEGLKKTAHMLEQETGISFDMMYFENLVLSGNWDEAERYLLGFIRVEDDKYSIKIYFEIRKQKFLEALDDCDRVKALDILVKDLKVFTQSNEEMYREMTQLLTLDDFRKHASLSLYGDTMSARKHMMNELKAIIEANPLFQEKLKFPEINESRLRRLINQSLNWQHIQCTYPQPDPEMKTLFKDHRCPLPDHPDDQTTENNSLLCEATSPSVSPFSGKSTSNPCTVAQSVISDGVVDHGLPTIPDATLESVKDSDRMDETRFVRTLDEVASAAAFPGHSHSSVFTIPEDLPKTVGRNFSLGSSPSSMDFHPIHHTFLLVGTDVGDVELWEVTSGEKLLSRKFRVWKIKAISMTFLEDLVKDPRVSVNRILWSPDGSLFGVAYSKHIVQLYSYHSGNNIRKQLEIDAHVGGVNDLAFAKPNMQLLVVTCGDDKLIQVWDVTTGAKQYTFEGHGAPVYSVCPHVKERIHFIFSTSTNGEIKAWLYDNMGPRVAYDAPGHCCTRMAYNADDKRLFSCGTNKDGESYVVEWDESEGYLRKTYLGLCKCSSGVVQFDMSKNRFLAAGDDHLIKVWDIDNVELLTTIDADGGLPASPHICFNKNGTFLAVSANHNRIKVLGNSYGLQLMQTSDNHFVDNFRVLSETLQKLAGHPIPTHGRARVIDGAVPPVGSPGKNQDTGSLEDVVVPELPAEPDDIVEVWNFSVIDEPSQFQSLRLLSEVKTNKKISRLIYSNAGNAILALAENGVHLLWKWSKNESNLSGKPTTKAVPQLWQPKSGLPMTNDVTDINIEKVMACFAFSKNDCYVASASGGAVSMFNMATLKRMRTFMPPPPAATCIAFYPRDNNIIAIGMEDSTIILYNFRVNEIIRKLRGHSEKITGLAFSNVLNVLVSSGADAQIVVWDTVGWEKKKSRMLQIYIGQLPLLETHVQFHQDQMHFLVVHESHLAIYETTDLERVKQWVIGDFRARISHATFSCDGQLIYAGFRDGTVLIFSASNFQLRCEINPRAYLPFDISSNVYPLVIAAHPREPNQFALGLTDGVVVIEPRESDGKWDVLPPIGNKSVNSLP